MKKFYLDVSLLIMLLATMNFHLLPKILHEVIGLAMFAAVVIHFYWNLRSFRSLGKFYLAVDILLAVSMLIIIGTGVIISHHLFKDVFDMALRRNLTIHQLHHAIPYFMMILIGLHLGRNWLGVKQRLSKWIKVPPTVGNALTIVFCGVGLGGVYLDQLVDRLLMHHIFGTAATQLPLGLYFVILIGMLVLFTSLGVLIDRSIKKF